MYTPHPQRTEYFTSSTVYPNPHAKTNCKLVDYGTTYTINTLSVFFNTKTPLVLRTMIFLQVNIIIYGKYKGCNC